eukprot:3483092-Rhodomonas_salina.1
MSGTDVGPSVVLSICYAKSGTNLGDAVCTRYGRRCVSEQARACAFSSSMSQRFPFRPVT